jgi:hypothetical protein
MVDTEVFVLNGALIEIHFSLALAFKRLRSGLAQMALVNRLKR